MKKQKYIHWILRLTLTGFCLWVSTTALIAQQQPQYTQFIFNKLMYNPAYAGSKDRLSLQVLYRRQWLGLEGAPQSQSISAHLPLFNNRVGFGAGIERNTIGITESINLQTMYAYRFILYKGYMSIGLSANLRYFSMDFTDERLVSTQALTTDAAISMANESKFVPNFGAGLYYYNNHFFTGLAVPNFLENNIDFEDISTIVSREVRHIYAMGGVRFKLDENLALQPSVLFKYAKNAPLDADINFSLDILSQYTIGVTYRVGGNKKKTGESIDLLLGIHPFKDLLIGLSYDISLSDIRHYNSGSMEILVQYYIGKSPDRGVLNPRFF